MVSIPVVDLSRRTRRHAAAFTEVVERVTTSGHVLLGPELEGLEGELAVWSAHRHVIGVASGATAIQLALAALHIGPGDEVLVPAFTAVPTAAAVCAVGATPVFVDVDRATAAVDAAAWNAARTERTKAIIVVHLYGRPAEVPITDLPVIEDAAQAHGALVPSGRRSAAVAYSFYPTKNLGGIGDGGALATDDDEIAAMIRRLRVHGMTEQYVHVERSQNFRMSEIEAGWLRLGLTHLADDNTRRRSIATAYRAAAPHLDWHPDHARHVYHLCVFRAVDRSAVRDGLAALDVATAIHYPLALTEQPAYRTLTRQPCPEAEGWAAQCISLPCFPEMSDAEVEIVANALRTL